MVTEATMDAAPELATSTLQDVILNNRRKSTLFGLTRRAATTRRLQAPSDATHVPTSSVARATDALQESNPFSPSRVARPPVLKVSFGSVSSSSDSIQSSVASYPSVDLSSDPDGTCLHSACMCVCACTHNVD